MMEKLATRATGIALMCVSSLALAQVGGDADANAQIENLQRDKKVLATRLSNAIAVSKKRASQIATMGPQLESERNKSKALASRLSNAVSFSKERAAKIDSLEQQLGTEKNKGKVLSNRLSSAIAFSKGRAARLNTLQERLDSQRNKNRFLSSRLSNAIAVSKERARLLDIVQPQLISESNKINALNSRLSNAIALSKERAALFDTLQLQLDSERNKNKILSRRLSNAIAYSRERAAQLSASKPPQSNWAAGVSADLAAVIGGVQGTTVVAHPDDSVYVQVGNNGLFRTGGTVLSAQGAQLLATIAQQLSRYNTNITVVGHTDNVPVGDNSRFSSNEELSFARAVSTLEFLRERGIPNEQLSAAGYGDGKPIVGNDTAEGRAQNRRVEIILRKQ